MFSKINNHSLMLFRCPLNDVGHRAQSVTMFQLPVTLMSDSVTSGQLVICSPFCWLNMNSKGSDQPTSSSEKHDQHWAQKPISTAAKSASTRRWRIGKTASRRAPTACCLRSCHGTENRVLSPNNTARTRGVSDCSTNCTLQHTSKRDNLLDLCLLGRVFL